MDLEESTREFGLDPPDRTKGEPAKISAEILSLYKAGEPLFSRELLRDIRLQLKFGSTKVLIWGINGELVDFEIETGQTYDSGDPDHNFIMYDPYGDHTEQSPCHI